MARCVFSRRGVVDIRDMEDEEQFSRRIEWKVRDARLNAHGVYVANWEHDVDEDLGHDGIVFRELWPVSDTAFARAVRAYVGWHGVAKSYQLHVEESGRSATMEVLQQ